MFLNILGRAGRDATEGVLALVGEWLLQVYRLFLIMEDRLGGSNKEGPPGPKVQCL